MTQTPFIMNIWKSCNETFVELVGGLFSKNSKKYNYEFITTKCLTNGLSFYILSDNFLFIF